MIHETIGSVGHLLVIISFVTALLATFSYFKATQTADELAAKDWVKLARGIFIVHLIAVIGVASSLFVIIYNHYFEYHYAFSHSSKALPMAFMISCYWEGQEGSFLLWIFWQAILGVILMIKNPKWEAPVMTVFALVQTFLTSMILGVILPYIDLKIGSSPFLLLREAQPDLPVWSLQPNFIPKDGRGLNPLLQNYWMVIHPPTLFLGFALTLVPFAYLIAGLWKNQLTEWIKPALPWALFGAGILGIGIMMGAYWAYETLNFGGYWNWDPVENASFVPWLVLIGAIHTMIAYKHSSAALKTSIILVIATFILVLYSTFLNRSGILGNASVHSFTDLGLSGQLLIYMLTFLFVAIFFAVKRWKQLPVDEKELGIYSREFWIFVGASILGLSAFQLIFTTSIPVYNKIAEAFGIVSNIALPADQVEHYSKIQIWIFLAIAALSAVGQYIWWGKLKESTSFKPLTNSALVATLFTVLFVNLGKVYTISYILLLWTSLFSVIANFNILIFLIRQRFNLVGGAMAHVGLAVMLIGILFSSGYSKVVSLNRSGFAISNKVEQFTKDDNKENKENLPLWLGQGAQMQDYLVTYKGRMIELRGKPGYYPRKDFEVIEGDFHAVALRNVEKDGQLIAKKGDTLTVEPENTYYELEFKNAEGKSVSLYPRWQVNPKMGTAISPDVKHAWSHDIYTYVSLDPRLAAEAGEEKQWSQTVNSTVSIGDTLFLNDFVAILQDVSRVNSVEDMTLGPNDAAVKAQFQVLGKNFQQFSLAPLFIIKGGMVAMPAFESEETGIKIKFTAINPKTQQFSFAVNTTQQDLIIIKALEKPYINLVWVGSILIFMGLFVAMYRRLQQPKAA
ncbi:cytochrome c biogenesis protein CcsA [Aquirufa nivalisilvae]|uniref:Putative cytochrome c biosynthesis protein n=1 Tax=Aquirufa nivalisilvae TaxID=2516557 RepID=A0A2S2DSL1_9BACT|nr:cytochrome c biogenesis protein CcsA [Aquirufa nivalisilvae]AWL08282.1 putative cytochrome c biosynthesis protein [Aquirufa nivalisilvae]MCZ2478752.1 cytochrome c biogenesis protein CcsA [Aquirufa nivalisilvae]MCZ2483488.1 cytochrome c biogenesis protein CcsA [Aquirufa nivalisilvae]